MAEPVPRSFRHCDARHAGAARQFDHFPYAEPTRPRAAGCACLQGTFDSLNPFNLRAGSTAQGLNNNGLRDPDGALAG